MATKAKAKAKAHVLMTAAVLRRRCPNTGPNGASGCKN